MTQQEMVLFLMLKGYTFDEAISILELMAEIAVSVSKTVNEFIENMRRLQAADEGKPR